jgi:hypothetical protein
MNRRIKIFFSPWYFCVSTVAVGKTIRMIPLDIREFELRFYRKAAKEVGL